MDILQRAADLIDRAQDRVAVATGQAARMVVSATQLRALEVRQAELRQQIEQATMDLGKLTFQRWKNHGVGNDAALAALCAQIDTLNAEYQRILSEIADARAAMAAPAPYTAAPGSPSSYSSAAPPFAGPALGMPSTVSYPPPPPLPALPPRPARECPECYAMVPGSVDFCPSCGMRV
jgi:TolA-binding protein